MPSILIVDDDIYLTKLLGKMLVREGYSVETAESGDKAIEEVSKKRYDILLLDIHMEGIDGIEAIPLIKKINANIPIIIITADHSPSTEKRIRREDIFYYLLKPFEFEELRKAVKSALSKKKNTEFNKNFKE